MVYQTLQPVLDRPLDRGAGRQHDSTDRPGRPGLLQDLTIPEISAKLVAFSSVIKTIPQKGGACVVENRNCCGGSRRAPVGDGITRRIAGPELVSALAGQ